MSIEITVEECLDDLLLFDFTVEECLDDVTVGVLSVGASSDDEFFLSAEVEERLDHVCERRDLSQDLHDVRDGVSLPEESLDALLADSKSTHY